MTALQKYQRLESPGLWRDNPDAQRREVIVAFRKATLVMADPKTETALTHWSLPAIDRLNPGKMPALYAPGRDSEETLEVDDPDMIAALETVGRALRKGGARRGRLRGRLALGLTGGALALGAWLLPDLVLRHTGDILRPVARAAISTAALTHLVPLTGAPCANPAGARALKSLAIRLFGPDNTPRVLVLRDGLAATAALPDGTILVSQGVVQAAAQPDAVAGYILAEHIRARANDPLQPLLRHAGVIATLQLFATGALPGDALTGYGEALLRAPATVADPAALLALFQSVGVSSAAYGYALDDTGTTSAALIEGDPYMTGSPTALLSAPEWADLQAICANAP